MTRVDQQEKETLRKRKEQVNASVARADEERGVAILLTGNGKVDQIASRLERSRGWIIKQALSEWIDQDEERSRLTREALAEVNAGHVIDHQAVQAWADSLATDNPLDVPH